MKNIKEVRDKLVDISQKLESGKIDYKTACEMHNGIGKIIKTCVSQLEYNKFLKKQEEIKFMESS